MDYRLRRTITGLIVVGVSAGILIAHPDLWQPVAPPAPVAVVATPDQPSGDAAATLQQLPVKGSAPKTGYARTQFGNGWASSGGCDTRNIILHRDMTAVVTNDKCQVVSGTLYDPYTGAEILFSRGEASSQAVQIDHVVALSAAWRTGAQQLTKERRIQLANDPLELLAVDGPANQQKSDGDAATWLPSHLRFTTSKWCNSISILLRRTPDLSCSTTATSRWPVSWPRRTSW